jgi:hypothetical protein
MASIVEVAEGIKVFWFFSSVVAWVKPGFHPGYDYYI